MGFDLRQNGIAVLRGHYRVLLDAVLLILLLVLTENFNRLFGKTTQRGFFCDDESLMYPYRENTVSPTKLHWIGFYLPLATLFLLETTGCCRGSGSGWPQLWSVYNTLRWFLFGHVAEHMIKDMGKQTIGRLRPHFFDVCRPQLADLGFCTDEAHRQGGVYHTVYVCRPDLSDATAAMLRDVHVSFPSGHSSMAFYGLVFLALHLQRIRGPTPACLLRPLCQFLCIALATFVGLSRVMDYKHHWSDVLAGSLLGASVAFAVVQAAELEQRLHLKSAQEHANDERAPAEDQVDTAAAEQLPHDLSQVTCHGTN